jgi:hypothetical protein
MPAYPRLALAQNLGQLADIEFAMRQDKKQPEPRRLGDGPHSGKKFVHWLVH